VRPALLAEELQSGQYALVNRKYVAGSAAVSVWLLALGGCSLMNDKKVSRVCRDFNNLLDAGRTHVDQSTIAAMKVITLDDARQTGDAQLVNAVEGVLTPKPPEYDSSGNPLLTPASDEATFERFLTKCKDNGQKVDLGPTATTPPSTNSAVNVVP
jgi:hypothetical protein